jgi:hypothetical protein
MISWLARPGEVILADPLVGPVLLLIHPHAVGLHRNRPEAAPATSGKVGSPASTCSATGPGALGRRRRWSPGHRRGGRDGLAEGESVWATVKATEVVAYADWRRRPPAGATGAHAGRRFGGDVRAPTGLVVDGLHEDPLRATGAGQPEPTLELVPSTTNERVVRFVAEHVHRPRPR